MDTHIIHKPPHHQERPLASPVGHRPYNNRLSSTGHQKKRPEGPFSPYAPFPNHRSSLRNGRYHCRSRAVLPTGAFPIALTETGNHIWFAWTLWVSILSGIHESPFWASSMAGYFDRKNSYAYFDRPLCSNKLFGQNVCPFCEDIQIGHTERTCRSPGSRDILEVQWAGIACQDTLSLQSGRPACPGTVCLSNMQGQNGRSSRTIIFMTKRNVPIQK